LSDSSSSGASAAANRSPSSSAARLLNVTAVIVAGDAPPTTSQQMRATSVVVLPDENVRLSHIGDDPRLTVAQATVKDGRRGHVRVTQHLRYDAQFLASLKLNVTLHDCMLREIDQRMWRRKKRVPSARRCRQCFVDEGQASCSWRSP
jgi:hypothetical protein